MSPNTKSIQKSIQIAARRPTSGIALLANTFTKCIDNAGCVTKDLKIEFCLLFLNSILDKTYQAKDENLSDRLQNKSIDFGIRLLKRYPQEGLKVLANLIIRELVEHQHYSQDELLQFYSEVFSRFFPETTHPAQPIRTSPPRNATPQALPPLSN
jgi:hypothetical protein